MPLEYADNRLSTGQSRRPGRSWLAALFDVLWMIGGLASVAILAGAVGGLLTPAVGYVAPAGGVLVLVVLAVLGRNLRRNRAATAVTYLEQAVRLNLPLPAMLQAAEQGERRIVRRRLRKLRGRIEAGLPIAEALRLELPGIPTRTLGLIAAGERLGQLPTAMTRAIRPGKAVPERDPAQAIMLRWYPITMMIAIPGVITLLNVFVMPMFKQIFASFGMPLPAETQWMLIASQAIQFPLALLIFAIFAIFCGRMLSEAIASRRPAFWTWRGITDRIIWYLPIWGGVVRARGMADLCYLLAAGTEAGQPIDRILHEAPAACGNAVLARRVERWGMGVSGGIDVAAAARDARMPRLLVGMLNSAKGEDGARNVFVFLRHYYDNRQSTAAAVISAAAVPLMVGVAALCVATVALSVFVPLVRLAERLSGGWSHGSPL